MFEVNFWLALNCTASAVTELSRLSELRDTGSPFIHFGPCNVLLFLFVPDSEELRYSKSTSERFPLGRPSVADSVNHTESLFQCNIRLTQFHTAYKIAEMSLIILASVSRSKHCNRSVPEIFAFDRVSNRSSVLCISPKFVDHHSMADAARSSASNGNRRPFLDDMRKVSLESSSDKFQIIFSKSKFMPS